MRAPSSSGGTLGLTGASGRRWLRPGARRTAGHADGGRRRGRDRAVSGAWRRGPAGRCCRRDRPAAGRPMRSLSPDPAWATFPRSTDEETKVTSSGTWKPTACILCECNCGIEVQLGGEDGRHLVRVRGDKRTRRRRATRARRRCASTTTRTAAIAADRAAAPPRRRHASRRSTGTPRSARSRRASRRCATRTAATRSSITAAAARGTTSPAPTRRRPRRALGSRYRSSALAQEKTGEFWVSAPDDRRATSRGDFEHCEVALFLGKNPWHSHGIPRARVTLQGDRQGSGAHADRHRSAPHRDRRARRHPPAGAARHRRLAARRAGRACSCRRTSSTAPGSRAHADGLEPVLAALARCPIAAYCARRRRRRGAGARAAAPHRRGARGRRSRTSACR